MIPSNSTITNSGLFFGTHSRMYKANKAKNQQGGSIPENRQVAQRFEDLDISESGTFVALQSVRLGNSFILASVSKHRDFSPENPIFFVTGRDKDGTYFREKVDIRDVNPRNASFIEMMALNGYRQANGQSQVQIMATKLCPNGGMDIPRINSVFDRTDFLTPLIELMSLQFAGNFEMFLLMQEMVDFLSQFPRN